jgi:hypothetical protein
MCPQFHDAVRIRFVVIQNHLHVDFKDVAKKWCQHFSAFLFRFINRRCGFHVFYCLTNDVVGKSVFLLHIVQEMSKSRVK